MMQRDDDRPLLVAEGLSKWYGKQLGCRDVSFALSGRVIAVVGDPAPAKRRCCNCYLPSSNPPPAACSIACATG